MRTNIFLGLLLSSLGSLLTACGSGTNSSDLSDNATQNVYQTIDIIGHEAGSTYDDDSKTGSISITDRLSLYKYCDGLDILNCNTINLTGDNEYVSVNNNNLKVRNFGAQYEYNYTSPSYDWMTSILFQTYFKSSYAYFPDILADAQLQHNLVAPSYFEFDQNTSQCKVKFIRRGLEIDDNNNPLASTHDDNSLLHYYLKLVSQTDHQKGVDINVDSIHYLGNGLYNFDCSTDVVAFISKHRTNMDMAQLQLSVYSSHTYPRVLSTDLPTEVNLSLDFTMQQVNIVNY